MEIMTGKIVTKFKNNQVTETRTKVNSETGEMYPEIVEHINTNDIVSEFFIKDDGKRYEICQECHEYIILDGNCENCDGSWF